MCGQRVELVGRVITGGGRFGASLVLVQFPYGPRVAHDFGEGHAFRRR